ncbi:DNA polymerase IV [Patescibacteria group bacterium]
MNRIILHIDMNCYFASVEQQANPFLRGKPIGITGKRSAHTNNHQRSVICTASIEAKRLGVKTAMSTWEAKKICPTLLLIAGDPEKYSEITHRFNSILNEFSDKVERFSVDESFLDLTDSAQDYLGATFIAQTIRSRLSQECGERITASIGLAPNKLMAKLTSERVKPNGLTVTRPQDVIKLLDSVELDDLCGIGPRIKHRLEQMGIITIKQLRHFPLDRLVHEFKSYGYWLHHSAHGRDSSLVDPSEPEPKSVGHSYTIPHDTVNINEIKNYLLSLSDKVAWRLRRDSYRARCVSAYVRYDDFSGTGQQHRFNTPTADGLKLFQIAWSLINKKRDPQKPIRLVGLSASQLSSGPTQISLFKKEQKMSSALLALDQLQSRYGDQAWTRASLVKTEIKPRSSGFQYDHEV